MTLKKREKIEHIFVCSLFCVSHTGGGGPTVLYASSVLGPNSRFGIRIRSIVFPCTFSIALTSIQSQLYSHVLYILSRADECIHLPSQVCWCACIMYPPFIKNVSRQDNLNFLKRMWFQNVFSIDWNTVLCPGRVFRRVLLRGKNSQNWGFEITNVRYGHQPAFCPHFNDGSNSCFQTTNWNAPQAGYLKASVSTNCELMFWLSFGAPTTTRCP